jgi:phage FluMu protein Com
MERLKVKPTPNGRVIPLTPERVLARAEKAFLAEPAARCPKCDSTFVGREPAFLHCRHCGKLARIAGASLATQELFELRSGLRIAV